MKETGKIKIIEHTTFDHDPDKRSWYYDDDGIKRDKITNEPVIFPNEETV